MIKKVVLHYYTEIGKFICSEERVVKQGSFIYNNIGKDVNPYDAPNEFDKEVLSGLEDAHIGEEDKVDYVSIIEIHYDHIKAPAINLNEVYTNPLETTLKKIQELSRKEPKTIIEKALKLTEETGEVAEAVLSFMKVSGCGYKNKTALDVIEECLDVIIMASSIVSVLTDKDEVVIDMINTKLNKWESKMVNTKE